MRLALKRQPLFRSRLPRTAVRIGTRLLLPDDRLLDVTIRNLSEMGFMAECSQPLAVGTRLGVDLHGLGIIQAFVRWSEDGELGCQFRRRIDMLSLHGGTRDY